MSSSSFDVHAENEQTSGDGSVLSCTAMVCTDETCMRIENVRATAALLKERQVASVGALLQWALTNGVVQLDALPNENLDLNALLQAK
jgi:hypothetical protein